MQQSEAAVMGSRGPIAEEDTRALVRIVGGAAESGAPPVERKHAIMNELASLVDADAWLWVVSRNDPNGAGPTALNVLHAGLDQRQVALVFEASYSTEAPPPENAPLVREMARGIPFTRRREDVVPDPHWRDDPHHDRFRAPLGLDEFVYSIYPFEDDLFSAVGLHRKTGRPAFTTRERRLVHIVISEVAWLHRAGLPNDLGREAPALTPRLRSVFGMLMQGWRRQQIADQLGITIHTARDHIRAVYRHFGVADHVELMARFTVGDGGDLPR